MAKNARTNHGNGGWRFDFTRIMPANATRIAPPRRANSASTNAGKIALLFVRPTGDFADGGALENAKPEHRALQPRRADADADVLEHDVLGKLRRLFEFHALDGFGQHRRRCLTDRAPFAGEF